MPFIFLHYLISCFSTALRIGLVMLATSLRLGNTFAGNLFLKASCDETMIFTSTENSANRIILMFPNTS